MYVMVCDFCDKKIADETKPLTLSMDGEGYDYTNEVGDVEFHFCTWGCLLNAAQTQVSVPKPEIPDMPPEVRQMWEAAEAQVDAEEPQAKVRIKRVAPDQGGTFTIGGGGIESGAPQPDDDIPWGGVKRR